MMINSYGVGGGGTSNMCGRTAAAPRSSPVRDDKEDEGGERENRANTSIDLRRRRQLAIHFSERSWDEIGICSCRQRRDSSASSSLQDDDDSDADGVGEERACNIRCIDYDDIGDDVGDDQHQFDINLCILERLIELHIVESTSDFPATDANSTNEQQQPPPSLLADDAPWRSELRHLVSEIRRRYNSVPFHSYYHATHVTLSANRLMAGLQQLKRKSDSSDDDECKNNNSSNHSSNRINNSNGVNIASSLERIAFVYTALIHDVSHVGISNEQLELEDHPIKRAYSNPERMRSYSECNSVDIGLDLLLGNNDHVDGGKEGGGGEGTGRRRGYDELRTVLFGVEVSYANGDKVSNGDKTANDAEKEDGVIPTFIALVRHMVMATDIASAERRKLGMERFERSFDKLNLNSNDEDDDLQSFCSEDPSQHGLKPSIPRLRQWTMFEQLVQLADVSHLTQSWETFILWNGRLYAELVAAYRRRMRELKDKTKIRRKGDFIIPPHPSEGWYQDQISFYDFYVIPLTERVQRLGALSDNMVQSIVENAKENRCRWAKEGRIATERIISSAASVGGGSVSVSLHFFAEEEGEERLAEVNFGDEGSDEGNIEAVEQIEIRALIERLGCHMPICVARYLGEEGNTTLFEKELQHQNGAAGGNKSSRDQSTVATKGSEGSSKWSWKRSKGGSSGSVSSEGSSRLDGSLHGSIRGDIPNIQCKRLSMVSEGSISSDIMLHTDTSSLLDSAMGPLFPLPLPAQPYCQAVLLLVDISGFSKLSTLLDVESLSRVINSYFEELLGEVQRYGGDVLKFAGDAFFCAWRIPPSDNDEQKESQDVQERLGQVCVNAALCGAAIVSKFTSYYIPGLPVKDATLSVHCGLGAGTISIIHVGDNSERREFLFLGDPVKQVADAIECAGLGELTASSFVRECLESPSGCRCNFDSGTDGEPCVIARRSERFFDLVEGQDICVDVNHSFGKEDSCLSNIVCTTENADVLRRQMELYVHPSARHDRGIRQPMGRCGSRRKSAARNKVLASAELRRVFTMFVKPDVDPTLTLDKENDDALFALLNDIMNITQQCLKRFKGHLRQFIVDDKGVVLILSWGQRGATFGNLVAEKGLPAAIALQDAFQFELNIDCRIGATFGKAYCGVVGGNDRHEFAILGSSVNLAARLACSDMNEGILVDDAVRKAANDSFDFFTLEPVYAKGYDGLVPIFEPQAAIERRWKSVDHFVGREQELEKLVRVARRQLSSKSSGKGSGRKKPTMALIQAHSGLGKSSFAMQAVETIRKLGTHFRTDVTVVRNVCRDGEEFVPFSIFRKIILELLVQKDAEENEVEDDSSLDISALTFDDASMVEGNTSDAIQLQRLKSLCAEMNYSDGIAIWLGYHLFDLSLNMEKDMLVTDDSKISPEEAVAFIADAFLTCVSSLDFVLLGIDDAHNLDELSWQVLDQLLKRGQNNLMVLVTSRPLESASQGQKVQPILEGLREDKRLTELNLKPFFREDVRELLAKSVGCDGRLIDKKVLQVVFEQSGGMPFFCTEMIKDIIEQDLTEVRDDGSVGWRDSALVQKGVYSNMNDFLLHRLDRLSSHGRELLQLCAILGLEFTLTELLLARFKGWPSKSEVDEILHVLSDADKDAILNQTCQTGTVRLGKRSSTVPMKDLPIGLNDRTFMFPHSMWRDCLLGTMLKERRQYLHRSVATRMGEEFIQHDGKLDHRLLKMYLKIFLHWNESGNMIKATNLAKRIGKHLASLQLHQQSLDVCMEAMKAWKQDGDTKKEEEVHIGGIPLSTIMRIDADDLVCLAQLHIAIARNPLLYFGGNYDASYYLNCREILRRAPAASEMPDRSIFFTLYSGMFLLYKNKYIKDEDGSALQRMASDFVEQATLHGDPIHIARALAMQGLTLGLAGKYEEALEVQEKLEEVYSPALSEGICREYTSDRAAQNFGYSVLWYHLLDRHAEADRQIEYIINELMPEMNQRDVHNAFVILLPLVWVLLDKGEAHRANTTFLQYVCDNYDKFYGDDSSSSTYYFYLYKPLRFLLRLACDTEEMSADVAAQYEDIESWIFSDDFCTIQRYLASYMCALGKDSNCILAEICCLLASDRSRPFSFSEERREQILRKGLDHAQLSMQDTEGQKGYDYARRQIVKIKRRLESALEKE